MEITYRAPAWISRHAWVGILPPNAPHGSAKSIDRRYLREPKEGKLSLNAPKLEGSYDLRLNTDNDGIELTSTTFKVSSEQESIPLTVPHGSTLQASLGEVKSDKIAIGEKPTAR